jgi:hypothetical protein
MSLGALESDDEAIRIFKAALILVGLLALSLVIGALAHYSGIRRANLRATPIMARAVYDSIRNGNFEASASSELVTDRVRSQLHRRTNEAGPVSLYEVKSIHAGPWGLPVQITFSVTRGKKRYEETLVRNTLGRFDDVVFD